MENGKFLIILTSVLLVISLSLLGLSFLARDEVATSPTVNDVCEPLEGGNGRFNIVFFSPDKEISRTYANYLLGFAPFSEHPSSFNTYHVKYNGENCKIYKNIALVCYSRSLVKRAAAACPVDFIIVLKEEDSQIRSSTYMNVLSLNLKHPLSVLPHEFGHAFAILADEYVPATIPPSSINCQSECEGFDEYANECFVGCSKENYKRSIDLGIMRSLYADSFGNFNSKIIDEKFDDGESKVSGNAVSLGDRNCANEEYYSFEAAYNSEDGKTTILKKSRERGCINGNGAGHVNYNLYDDNGNLILSDDFNPTILYTDLPDEKTGNFEGGSVEVSSIFIFSTPVIEDATHVELRRKSLDGREEITARRISEIEEKESDSYSGEVIKNVLPESSTEQTEDDEQYGVDIGPVEEISASDRESGRIKGGTQLTARAVSELIESNDFSRKTLMFVIAALTAALVLLIYHSRRKKDNTSEAI